LVKLLLGVLFGKRNMCISLGGFDVMNRKTYIGAMPDELFKV
jgi:hypothetical protein